MAESFSAENQRPPVNMSASSRRRKYSARKQRNSGESNVSSVMSDGLRHCQSSNAVTNAQSGLLGPVAYRFRSLLAAVRIKSSFMRGPSVQGNRARKSVRELHAPSGRRLEQEPRTDP